MFSHHRTRQSLQVPLKVSERIPTVIMDEMSVGAVYPQELTFSLFESFK